jgi:hypothetical protein
MGDLVEVLGKKRVELVLGEETFVLAPLTLNDLAECEARLGNLEDPRLGSGLQVMQFELWAAAKNGGYAGTVEDLAAKIGPQDVSIVRARLSALLPKTQLQRALTLLIEAVRALEEGHYPGLTEHVAVLGQEIAEAVKAEQGADEGNALPASSETGPDKPGA